MIFKNQWYMILHSHIMNFSIDNIKGLINKIPQVAQQSDDWHKIKKMLITATEISTILNCNPFQTINELYYQKRHPESSMENATESITWGHVYEPIAKKCLQLRSQLIVDIIDLGLAKHPILLYLGASPDGLLIVNDNGKWRLWLVEIKCLHKREISGEVPYNYWLQMQTQLYVWRPLLEKVGLQLEGCLYCENQFEEISDEEYQNLLKDPENKIQIGSNGRSGVDHRYYKLTKYWEKQIFLENDFYVNKILPEIELFKQFLDNPQKQIHITEIPKGSVSGKKRKRSEDEEEDTDETSQKSSKKRKLLTNDIFYDYLNDRKIITQKQYRNFTNQEPLLDWLDLYGNVDNSMLDPSPKYDIKSFIYQQYQKLLNLVYDHVKKTAGKQNYIQICENYPLDDELSHNFTFKANTNTRGLSRLNLNETIESMSKGVPVILNGVLYNPDNNKLGYYNIIIKNSQLASIFPISYKKLRESKLPYNKDAYTFIQVKYSKLKLCAKNTYLLNSGSQKVYKIEQVHLHQVFEYYQKNMIKSPSFIMGRKSTYTTKGVTYNNYNAYNSFGLIDPSKRDKESLEDINAASEWLMKLRSEGKDWIIDPPQKRSLRPNLKNTQDYPWGTYKQYLSTKNKDLTRLWYLGNSEIYRLWESGDDTTCWDELNVDNLKFNQHYKNIISNIIEANKSDKLINIENLKAKLIEIKKPIEFFLDFEFVSDLDDDFEKFPISNSSKYIYMSGYVYVNHQNSEIKYINYMVNRLKKRHEGDMLKTWLTEMDNLNDNQEEINIYHWGSAEKLQLETYLTSQNQLQSDGSNKNILKRLNLIDLCELFKHFEVGIPGCFGYGLKEVLHTFHKKGWVKTIWDNKLTGEDAMIAAIVADKDCEAGHYETLDSVPLMKDFIRYNYVDCKGPHEIVEFVRNY